MRFRNLCLAAGFALWSVALVGASCDKKSIAKPGDVGDTGGADRAKTKPGNGAGTGTGAGDDVAGVDTGKMSEGQKGRFNALLDKYQSPCGKAHSLRTSLKSDPSCKRAVFAARYVARLIGDDVGDDDLAKAYSDRYQQKKTYAFDLKGTPYEGVPSAPIVIVEFFDYGCPHCKAALPMMEDLAADYPSDLVIYFKHFPLSSHKDSVNAAMAAVAAQRQGKFKEMHRKLFASQDDQSKEALFKYAKEIGLDMKKFQTDFDDPAVRDKVLADRKEGEVADLQGTPTMYINGRMVTDAPEFDVLKGYVEEELAVNR